MRIFENLLIVVLFISLLLRSYRWEKTPWVNLFPLTSLLVMGYHFFMEGARWQMIPLYILALALIPSAIKLASGRKSATVIEMDNHFPDIAHYFQSAACITACAGLSTAGWTLCRWHANFLLG